MVAVVLFVLAVGLVLAAGYVGLLILRRSRPTLPPDPDAPQTVGELVRERTAPPPEDLSGKDLFAPTGPRRSGAAPSGAAPSGAAPASDPGADASGTSGPLPAGPPVTPPGGVEAGDAPWRRAARMMGSEPGAGWETAPLPVVAAPDPAPDTVTAAHDEARDDGRDAPAGPALTLTGATRAPVEAVPAPDPTPGPAASPAPADPAAVADRPVPAAPPDVSDAPSRPLSDPEMTPLMGIPVVRPPAAVPTPARGAEVGELDVLDAPGPQPGPPAAVTDPEVAAAVPAVPAPPRSPASTSDDDDVVWMQQPAATPHDRPPVVTGSPQPVWFRVVNRDGDPVAGAVVSLLDDHGREADATKTATDGGGELHAPHSGRFLMIAGAERFQPRAALLTVEEQPVEIALLLPRSAVVAGVVRTAGAALAEARVTARQEGEVVDETVTDRDGGYRFDDLAGGAYALSAAHAGADVQRTVTLSEGADLQLDLDLGPGDGAR